MQENEKDIETNTSVVIKRVLTLLSISSREKNVQFGIVYFGYVDTSSNRFRNFLVYCRLVPVPLYK